MYRMPEEDSDLRQVIRNVGFFHNVLSGEDYEIFIKEFGEQLSLKTVSPGKTVYHKGNNLHLGRN